MSVLSASLVVGIKFVHGLLPTIFEISEQKLATGQRANLSVGELFGRLFLAQCAHRPESPFWYGGHTSKTVSKMH